MFGPLAPCLPRLARCVRPPPAPRGKITTPADFLKTIGRGVDSKVTFDEWNAFWACDGDSLKKAGLGVQERRYVLWCMEKYRRGWELADIAREVPKKKQIRGRGPAVQNGKRIRS